MDVCCGLVCGYASEVVNVAEDNGSPMVELPGDETGDVLAVSCCPPEAKWEADVSVIGSIDSGQSPGSSGNCL